MKDTSLAKLTIDNIEFYAYHGVKDEERTLGGKYQVDLDLYYDSKEAAIHDDVSFAINYEEALFVVAEIVDEDSYHLIETIANEILNQIMDKFPQLVKATVRLRKFSVPMRRVISHVQIEQSISRKDF